MTRLESGKTIKRETATMYRGRPLVIELHPRHVAVRQKGKRTDVVLGYDAIYEAAYKLLWRAQQAAKKAARKEGRRGR